MEDITGRCQQDNNEDDDTDNDDLNQDIEEEEEEILNSEMGEGSRKNSFLLVKKLILPEVCITYQRFYKSS